MQHMTQQEMAFAMAALSLVLSQVESSEGSSLHMDAAYALDNLFMCHGLDSNLQGEVARKFGRRMSVTKEK